MKGLRTIRPLTLIVITLLICQTTLFADCVTPITITSINSGGNWSDPLTWSPAIIPTQCDTVIIDRPVVLDANIIIGDPMVAGRVNVTTSGSLTGISNTVEIREGGTLLVDGSCDVEWVRVTHNSGSIVNSGTMTMHDHFENEGSVVNTNEFTVDGNHNYRNLSGGFTVNNGTITIGNDFRNDLGATFMHNTIFNILDDFDNDGVIMGNCGQFIVGDEGTNSATGVITGTVDLCIASNLTNLGFIAPTVTYCDPCGLLPVEFVSFTATQSGQAVSLNWTTAGESPMDYYDVERSQDLKFWESVGTMPASAIPDDENSYVFDDLGFASGVNYYRIAQTGNDGQVTFSNIQTVNVEEQHQTTAMVLYPNPLVAGTPLKINLPGCETCPATIEIYDLGGKRHQTTHLDTPETSSVYSLPTTTLTPGLYIVRVQDAKGSRRTGKIIIQ